MSFVFYDTETTGIDTRFDQILQFAAIRTDHELNEIERFQIRSRLNSHIVPSPDAIRVTGIPVKQLIDRSLPSHYEMIQTIRARMIDWSPCIFVGYNSLHFDEHLLRQALYQTLHPPYMTNTNGNCRLDAMRVVQATTLFSPGTLSIPTADKSRLSFTLERVARANDLTHDSAHEAMADVEAMLHVCKLMSERSSDVWSSSVRFAKKASVTDFVMNENIFSLSDFYYGRPFSWLVTTLGAHPDNSTEILVFDLAVDPDELTALPDDDIAARLNQKPKPVRSLRSNAGPILMPVEEAPTIAAATALDQIELERRAHVLHDDEPLRKRLISAFTQSHEKKETSVHVEEQIYDGFFSREDQSRLDQFHSMPWRDRLSLTTQFEDQRLRQLGRRLVFSERPDLFDDSTQRQFETTFAERKLGIGGSCPWLTLPKAIKRAEELIANSVGAERVLLEDFRAYLVEQSERATKLVG